MRTGAWIAFAVAALLVFLPGLRDCGDGGSSSPSGEGIFPSEFEGYVLEEEPLTEREAAFAKDFPGRIARFRGGGNVVLMRYATQATHRLHSASACLAASGWEVEALPLVQMASGGWSCFCARKGGEVLHVREQVRAADGTTLADVPTWFWSALLGRTRGPWLAVSVIAR